MHTRMAALSILLATGCASTGARERVMDASEAAALGQRAHVLSLNGEDAYGTIGKTDGGLALITANGRAIARLEPQDTVRVEIDPSDGRELPEESVHETRKIRKRPAPHRVQRARSDKMTTAGVAALVPGVIVGAIGFIGTATVHYSPPPPCGLCINVSIDPRPLFWAMAALGATASVIGTILLVSQSDATSRPRAKGFAIAPIVSPTMGGGAVFVAF